MGETTLIMPLTGEETRTLVREIKEHLSNVRREEDQARAKILRIYRTEAWRELGYASFAAFGEAEFAHSYQHVYRLARAAQVDMNIGLFSPAGNAIVIPETHARHLAKLPDAETQWNAFSRAKKLARSEGAKAVTANHMARAVRLEEEELFSSQYAVIQQMVAGEEITAKVGHKMTALLDAIPPGQRGQMLELITRHGLTCAELISPVGEMLVRLAQGDESKVLRVLLDTGNLAGVPLKDATMSDLRRANNDARQEHITEALEKERQAKQAAGQTPVVEKVITVFVGDPVRTLEALRRELGVGDIARIRDLLMVE